MGRFKSVASYAGFAFAIIVAYFPAAASAQEDAYSKCVQGCFQSWGANSPYRNPAQMAQCVSICEQRYLGGPGNQPPKLPPPPSGLPITVWQ